VSKGTLWKRLRERGLIEVEEAGRNTKKTPGRGYLARAVALQASALWKEEEGKGGVFGEVA